VQSSNSNAMLVRVCAAFKLAAVCFSVNFLPYLKCEPISPKPVERRLYRITPSSRHTPMRLSRQLGG
jgi:hypothetical protein